MSENLTVLDKARVKAHDYADDWEERIDMLMADEGTRLHAVIKNSYMQGYLDGFKFRLTGDSE